MLDSKNMSPEEYQDHMDKLAMKISQAMEGNRVEDGISACAACIGFGMVQLPADQHEKMSAHISRIISAILARAPRPQ